MTGVWEGLYRLADDPPMRGAQSYVGRAPGQRVPDVLPARFQGAVNDINLALNQHLGPGRGITFKRVLGHGGNALATLWTQTNPGPGQRAGEFVLKASLRALRGENEGLLGSEKDFMSVRRYVPAVAR